MTSVLCAAGVQHRALYPASHAHVNAIRLVLSVVDPGIGKYRSGGSSLSHPPDCGLSPETELCCNPLCTASLDPVKTRTVSLQRRDGRLAAESAQALGIAPQVHSCVLRFEEISFQSLLAVESNNQHAMRIPLLLISAVNLMLFKADFTAKPFVARQCNKSKNTVQRVGRILAEYDYV